jgi:hypothetical protein
VGGLDNGIVGDGQRIQRQNQRGSQMNNLEHRVGLMAITVIENHLNEYIRAHTKEGKYVGQPRYLLAIGEIRAYQIKETLRQEGKTNGN